MLRSSFKIATILGIPIKLHISLLLMLPMFALQYNLIPGLMLEIGLLLSIVLHELGHSVVAIAKGCRVREILLMPLGGAAMMESIPTRPLDEFLMAVAGPAVSLALGLAGVFWGSAVPFLPHSYHGLNLFHWLGIINLGLVFFNLLPSFPMDGGRVFRAILTPKLGRLKATYIASRVGKLMAIIFGLIGFFSSPSQWILVAIAFFIFISAENEYRMVQAQEAAKQADFGPWAAFGANWLTPTEDDEDVVEVSPPPYERGRKSKTELRHENRNPFRR